jgi:acetyl-CoA C-acetyltransferase
VSEVVIVDAVRTPIGRKNGTLSHVHANDLLGTVQRAIIERNDLDPLVVGQVVGGCVQ